VDTWRVRKKKGKRREKKERLLLTELYFSPRLCSLCVGGGVKGLLFEGAPFMEAVFLQGTRFFGFLTMAVYVGVREQ